MLNLLRWFKPKRTRVQRYYREWMACWGWGVMALYDTVWAVDRGHARSFATPHQYCDDPITHCVPVRAEHLHMTNQELSEIYGDQQ